MSTTSNKASKGLGVAVIVLAAIVVASLLVVAGIQFIPSWMAGLNAQTPPQSATAKLVEAPKTFKAPAKECAATWKMDPSVSYDNNYWFEDGIVEIQSAVTPEDATAASRVWLDRVRKLPDRLVGAVQTFLERDVDITTLTDTKGCATKEAKKLVYELRTLFASSTFTVKAADPNGFNSGVADGTVVFDPESGVGGDLTAIMVTLPDGRVVWIMAKCGNLVTPGLPPKVPTGKIQRENIDQHVADPFVANGGPTNTVSYENGAVVPNGLQVSEAQVAADQKAAADKAAAEQKVRDDAAQAVADAAAKAALAAAEEEKGALPPGPPPG